MSELSCFPSLFTLLLFPGGCFIKMCSELSLSDESQQRRDSNDDGRGVHLIYSEYDSAPSETDVEVMEGAKHYWWQSSKCTDQMNFYYNHAPHGTNNYCSTQCGREVCLVYSDYDEPSSEISVDMSQLFRNKKIDGHEVSLIYSEYDEPPSETDVEYDGRPWCSIFGNPAFWKVRDEGREIHLIYSDHTEPKSEAAVEIEYDSDLDTSDEGLHTARQISRYTDISTTTDTNSTISSDIYTPCPPESRPIRVRDSLEFVGLKDEMIDDESELFASTDDGNDSIPAERSPVPVQHLDNMEELLAFANSSVDEDSVLGYLEGQELNTAKCDSPSASAISTDCHTALGNSFSTDYNAYSDSVMLESI
ncbi:unnamed protein product [Litomosoides sigmodontis]|uniref:Uncharacterized protein n=1 Tax=Litomosoides sigmodontis TaxID=42156 RepID=A0A3P6T1L6_LITSI|nr:unnamed protein product [Litomosoides sigmodontis]